MTNEGFNDFEIIEKELKAMCETLIFDKKELQYLGRKLERVINNEENIELFKQEMLKARVRILNDIIEFAKFYVVNLINMGDQGFNGNKESLQADLDQKNALLQEIALRLKNVSD